MNQREIISTQREIINGLKKYIVATILEYGSNRDGTVSLTVPCIGAAYEIAQMSADEEKSTLTVSVREIEFGPLRIKGAGR